EGTSEQRPMPSAPEESYEFGLCRLDVAQHLLMRQDERIPLPPKTFELLLLFVRSPGRAFSKQELMTALWPETFVEEANLSFQISTLRKALGNGTAELIETVSKHGYRFAANVGVRQQNARLVAPEPIVRLRHGVGWWLSFVIFVIVAAAFGLVIRAT